MGDVASASQYFDLIPANSTMSSPPKPSRFAPYKTALEALSTRTRTPLPSLIVSFAVLHEITAIVPLVSVFFAGRSFGLGESVVRYIRSEPSEGKENHWIFRKSENWLDEGESWAGRVGRRYGILGFPKTPKGTIPEDSTNGESQIMKNVAGDVANAMLAYGVTKVNQTDTFFSFSGLFNVHDFLLGIGSSTDSSVYVSGTSIF